MKKRIYEQPVAMTVQCDADDILRTSGFDNDLDDVISANQNWFIGTP